MSQLLTIELPDDIYRQLATEATAVGKTVAEVVAERVARGVERPPGYGRLRRMAGCINTGLGDVSARHRDYLTDEMLDPHQERPDGGPVR
ncbi:MAG: hypothetical protein U0871_29380 [Gemmataceae bacterium]